MTEFIGEGKPYSNITQLSNEKRYELDKWRSNNDLSKYDNMNTISFMQLPKNEITKYINVTTIMKMYGKSYTFYNAHLKGHAFNKFRISYTKNIFYNSHEFHVALKKMLLTRKLKYSLKNRSTG